MKKIFSLLIACLCVTSLWSDVYYEQCTQVSDFFDGGTYIIVTDNGSDKFYALQQSTTNAIAITVESDGRIKNPASNIIWTAKTCGDGFSFEYDVSATKKKYVGNSQSKGKYSTTLSATADSPMEVDIAALSDGINTFKLVFKASDRYFGYSGNSKFAAYVESNFKNQFASGGSFGQYAGAIHVYRKVVADLNVTTAQYATYYNATEAYKMPAGLEGITVEGVSGTNLTLNNTHYAAGSVVPAGEALVLHATEELTEATEFTLYAGTTSAEKISDNMLKGTSTAEEETIGGAPYYRLSQHDGQVGFYYGAEGGVAFKPGANKAYLALNGASAPARFIFGQQDVPTELQNVSAETVSRKVVIDGRLYIVRDGNMFDLNGRLVK